MATAAKTAPATKNALAAAARVRGVEATADDFGTVTLVLNGRARLEIPYRALVGTGTVKANGRVVGQLSMPTLTFTGAGCQTRFLGRVDAMARLVAKYLA